MISQCWNFFRACPAIDVQKLNSEYRSTYQWHDFKPPLQTIGVAGKITGVDAGIVVIKRPPQPLFDDFNFSRKKKHPDVAYRSHEFFDTSLASTGIHSGSGNRMSESVDGSDKTQSERHHRSRYARSSKIDGNSSSGLDNGGSKAAIQRRARSEGPINRKPRWKATSFREEIGPIIPTNASSRSNLADGNHQHSQISREGTNTSTQTGMQRNGIKHQRGCQKENVTSSTSRHQQMKESISMGQIQATGNYPDAVPAKMLGGLNNGNKAMSANVVNDPAAVMETDRPHKSSMALTRSTADKASSVPRRRSEYKTEYRKSFRPFSHYEYAGGRFFPVTVPIYGPGPQGTASLASVHFAETKQKKSEHVSRPADQTVDVVDAAPRGKSQPSKAVSLHGEPWYNEVVELRRQAHDYKFRGWGTETGLPGTTQGTEDNYNKQREDLYEAASNRESLSALSLAFTSPRPTSQPTHSEKTVSLTRVPGAPLHSRPLRPRTAPGPYSSTTSKPPTSASSSQQPPSSKSSVTSVAVPSDSLQQTATEDSGPLLDEKDSAKENDPPKRGAVSTTRGSLDKGKPSSASKPHPRKSSEKRVHSSSGKSSTGVSARTSGRTRSPVKRERGSRPPSASTASSSVAPSPAPASSGAPTVRKTSGAEKLRKDSVGGSSKESDTTATKDTSTRRQRPNGVGNVQVAPSTRRPFSRSSSKGNTVGGISRDTSRPPSAFENQMDYFREPVVKSPPEPTRVKSPTEIMVRSPDPINWTVPLDTGKTFSVTQSVRDGDSPRSSPMSDALSCSQIGLFDTVSGTAINLGNRGCGSRVSGLAKEACVEPQPGLIKDSTMTRPAKVSSSSHEGVNNGNDSAPSRLTATEARPNPVILEDDNEASTSRETTGINSACENIVADANDMCDEKKITDQNGSLDMVNVTEGKVSEEKLPTQPTVESKSISKPIPGTTLKCLEDPSFEFDSHKPVENETCTSQPPPAKKPAYRVLEDPFEAAGSGDIPSSLGTVSSDVSNVASDAHKSPKQPSYKILEAGDPMVTSMYDATTSLSQSPTSVTQQ